MKTSNVLVPWLWRALALACSPRSVAAPRRGSAGRMERRDAQAPALRLLPKGVAVTLPRAGGRIVCRTGRLWLTDGRSGDVFLAAGEASGYGRDAVIEALEDSVVGMAE